LFAWSTPHGDYSLLGLSGRVLHHDDEVTRDLRELARLVDIRAQHELELRVIAGGATLSGTAG
jgi:hypothetical protein